MLSIDIYSKFITYIPACPPRKESANLQASRRKKQAWERRKRARTVKCAWVPADRGMLFYPFLCVMTQPGSWLMIYPLICPLSSFPLGGPPSRLQLARCGGSEPRRENEEESWDSEGSWWLRQGRDLVLMTQQWYSTASEKTDWTNLWKTHVGMTQMCAQGDFGLVFKSFLSEMGYILC
jgi:hypothetical protein